MGWQTINPKWIADTATGRFISERGRLPQPEEQGEVVAMARDLYADLRVRFPFSAVERRLNEREEVSNAR